MEKIKAVICNINYDINNLEPDNIGHYDFWQMVLNYPLIFLPENKIVFYGFNVKLLKNEYNLLKSIISLNSNSNNNDFSEEQIVEPINYKRVNTSIEKSYSYKRFIITTSSSIKRKIKEEIITACINCIRFYQYDPVDKIYECNKRIKLKSNNLDEQLNELNTYVNRLAKNNKFKKTILNKDLNLVKIIIPLQEYTDPYHQTYSSFIPNVSLQNLISMSKGQKQYSEHRYFRTSFVFDNEIKIKHYEIKPRLKQKHKDFLQAKSTPTKYNIENFINS